MTVNEWIENGCNYQDGVALFARLSPKSKLNDYFHGDPRFKDRPEKLKYELSKLQVPVSKKHKQKTKKLVNSVPDIRETIIITHTEPNLPTDKAPENETSKPYPEVIQSAIDLYSSLYKNKAVIWKQRFELGFDNSADLVNKRKALSDEIIELSNKMELLWKVKDEYERLGVVPEENVAADIEAEKDVPLPNSVDELKKLKKNLQTNNCKDGNLLEYQSKQAKQRKTPMPPGPRRTKIEERIKERNTQVVKIDDKLKLLNAGKAE